ncbi:MAG TPA: STM3941 family protein [Allosphingosinicella sp.]|nr:STM3941 family protein [Allosphingosinicella sp.]
MADAFVARNSPARIVLWALGSVALALLSLWVAGAFGAPPRPGREWLGWTGAVLFALLAAMWAMRLRDSPDQIVIDRAGLTWRQWSDEHIPWSAVREIEERRMRGQTFFAVYLDDPRANPPTRLLGKLATAQSVMGQGHFTMIVHGTDRTAEELREALRLYWSAFRRIR